MVKNQGTVLIQQWVVQHCRSDYQSNNLSLFNECSLDDETEDSFSLTCTWTELSYTHVFLVLIGLLNFKLQMIKLICIFRNLVIEWSKFISHTYKLIKTYNAYHFLRSHFNDKKVAHVFHWTVASRCTVKIILIAFARGNKLLSF